MNATERLEQATKVVDAALEKRRRQIEAAHERFRKANLILALMDHRIGY